MTGPEHYQQAEEFLELAEADALDSPQERFNLAAAQVHATLALAAATAEPIVTAYLGDDQDNRVRRAWTEAIS